MPDFSQFNKDGSMPSGEGFKPGERRNRDSSNEDNNKVDGNNTVGENQDEKQD